jgi:MinD-like ATPase involved in chromosome partitioning or flagellar assembly
MNVVFCGLVPPDLPPGHRAVQCSSVNELNGQADITVVSDSVPGWQDVRIGGRSYLVSDNLSLEIIEAAEAAGYAGVWASSELPVRLAALLRAGETGEVRQLRRPLERTTVVPGDAPPQRRVVNRDDFYGDEHRPAKIKWPVEWPESNRRRNSARFQENAPGDDLQVIPQQYVPRQTIAFNSAGGGKGKSVLTAATAVMLATDPRFHASVVAVDLDPFAGTLARKLGVSPRFSILDWINGAVDDITRCLTPVPLPGTNGNSRLMVLSGPEREEDGAAITAEVAQNLLTTLQRRFDIVLVDTRPEMMDATLVALENAQHIFLIDVPDVTSLRNTMKRAHILADLGMLHKLHMVLNRVPKLSVMRMDVVDEIPSATEVIMIPEDIGVQVAVNRLEPVGLSRRTRKFTRAMSGILKQIVPNYVEPGKNTGRFFSFFRRRVAF